MSNGNGINWPSGFSGQPCDEWAIEQMEKKEEQRYFHPDSNSQTCYCGHFFTVFTV